MFGQLLDPDLSVRAKHLQDSSTASMRFQDGHLPLTVLMLW
jgi:hypothetical protein